MKDNKILIFMLFIWLILIPSSVLSLELGEKAPPFVNPDLEKQHVWSKNFLGKGWVILDFFATDCEGCIKEMPILEELFSEFEDLGLQVLVFATDADGADIVKPYFQQNPTPLTVLLDRYQVAVKKYQVTEIPSLFLVNPEGLIVLKETGFVEDLFELISSILISEQ